ncbi:MAG: hypothetical protein HQL88_04540 [Magnetococcales bacterium]|nr:hypothetical protein [Magnetococcales bacterium]
MTIESDIILDRVLARLQMLWSGSGECAPSEFELRRLERVVGGFCRTEPVRAYYLLGVLATLREDTGRMHACFRNALRHSGHDHSVRRGYGICLVRLRYFAEAREQYEAIFAQNNQDLDVLAELIVTSLATGRIREGVRWIQHWSRLHPDRPFEEADSIAKSAALLEKHGISDDHVERLQRLALGILEREFLSIQTIHYQGVPEEDPEWISADLVVDESEEVVHGLNSKLSKVLHSQAPPPRLADVIKFTYTTGNQSTPTA